MQTIHKQRVALCNSIDEMLSAYENGEQLSNQNWMDLNDAFGSFGLPLENILFELVEKMANNDTESFTELRRYFDRMYDNVHLAAAESCLVSEDYTIGKFGYDREFASYISYIHSKSSKELYNDVYERLIEVKEKNPDWYSLITAGSRGWYFETNWLDGVDGDNNSLITNRIAALKCNADKLVQLYTILSDAVSRRSLLAIIKFYLTWDYSDCLKIASYADLEIDTSIYPFYENEVFVDCGCYIGDTVVQYANVVNDKWKQVYTYDISRPSIEVIKKNLADLNNVDIRHKGTGDKNTLMTLVGMDQPFHGNKLSSTGEGEKIPVVRLDDDIKEPISYLKIDCEGMDKETLNGAYGHIRKYHPKLHVDSYHKLGDLIDIPFLILKIDPTYSLSLRIMHSIGEPFRFPITGFYGV